MREKKITEDKKKRIDAKVDRKRGDKSEYIKEETKKGKDIMRRRRAEREVEVKGRSMRRREIKRGKEQERKKGKKRKNKGRRTEKRRYVVGES